MLIALTLVLVASLAVLAYALVRAPEGYQDESGFHVVAKSEPQTNKTPSPARVVTTSDSRDEGTGNLAHST